MSRNRIASCGTSRSRIEEIRELVLEHNADFFAVDEVRFTPFDVACRLPEAFIARELIVIFGRKMAHDHSLHVILGVAEYTFFENEPQILLPLGTLTCTHFCYLLSTLDPNLIRNRDKNGKLPMHLACRNNAPAEVLAMLVEVDAAALHVADYAGVLPLHECCCGVVDDAKVRFFVEQGGVGTLAARTREGALPLHVLCGSKNPSLRTVQYMIWCFPGSMTARTNAGHYPFVIAACESSTASLSVVSNWFGRIRLHHSHWTVTVRSYSC